MRVTAGFFWCQAARSVASFAPLWLLSCSTLPESAAPKLRGEMTPSELESHDVIPYRTLTRSDFKGREPPPEFASVASRLGATTCSHLLTVANTRVMVTERHMSSGETEFASRPQNLRFRALMDRSCSWWNDELAALRPEYVLQHEQIHFAITELAARRLNESAAGVGSVEFTADTQDEALRLGQKAIQDELLEGSEVVLDRSRDFDEDTSMGYEPARQLAWFTRISAELEETRAWAER